MALFISMDCLIIFIARVYLSRCLLLLVIRKVGASITPTYPEHVSGDGVSYLPFEHRNDKVFMSFKPQ